VAVLDARLPDGNGIDVCREVRSVDPGIQVLILTSYEDDEALFAAIMAGAAGYCAQADPRHRPGRTRSGGSPPASRCWTRPSPSGCWSASAAGSRRPNELKSLTEQERRILLHVAEGLTNREIAAKMFLAEKTVKNYVSSLLAKLGLERRTQAAVLATKLLGEHR
jgi:DNA-binding NarL/FixJ family response regulator